ncbi:MAG: 5'-nucleotidase C-terminal domain-containing protein, partial [Clostridiales bacterium]|nr:5'-nucleotidase C-terminal domain-containing protein [Clostridiales bacterium]
MRKSLSKKLLSAALALAVALSCIAFNPAKAQAEAGDTFDFQVLFTSDLHGCFGDWSYSTNSAFTGLGRLATEINRLKEENPDTVLLDMGDAIQGNGTSAFHTPAWDEDENNTYGMYPAVIGFETLGYDYAVLGNHEFNFGIARLEKAYEGFSGAVVSGNVFDENGEKAYDSYYIKDFTEEGGPRVAFIGMTHPNIVNWDAGNMTAAGYTVSQADEETAKVIEYLKSDEYAAENGKIDMFIATQHMGDTAEYGAGDSAESVIAMNGEDLSLFIGAHYHANVAKQIDGVWFAEVSSNGGRLGQVAIKATQTEDGWELANVEEDVVITNITVSNSAPVDPAYMEALKGADTFAKAYTNTVVGALEGGPLVPVPEIRGTYQAYFQDTALVHRINEAMLYTANEYVKRTPELAEQGKEVTLSGTAPLDTNANAQPGNLTRGAVSTIYKYDNNTLNITEMTGEQFKRWMEWAYLFIGDYTGDGYDGFNLGPAMEEGDLTVPYGNGNMPGYNMDQFLGLDYKVDLTRPYGERIVEMKNPDGTDFDLEGTYWVAVNNYRTDSQLRINAAEGTRPAVYPEGYDPAVVIAENIDAVLTVDGEDPVNNGEGMLGVMVDWINRVKGGTIDNEFTPNWEYITPEIDMEARAKAINLANAGVISMLPEQVGDSTGFNYARRSLTLEDVEGVEEILDIFSFNDFHGTV